MKLLRINPFARVLFPFVFGIIVAKLWLVNLQWLGVGIVATLLILGGLYFKISKTTSTNLRALFGLATSIQFALFGAFSYAFGQHTLAKKQSHFKAHLNQSIPNVFKVVSKPLQKNSYWQFQVQLIHNKSTNLKGIAYLPDTLGKPIIGSYMASNQKLQELAEPSNPGQFNFKEFSANQNVFFTLFLKSNNTVDYSDGSVGSDWFKSIQRFCISVFKKHLKGDEFGLTAALVLGDKSYLSQSLRGLYANVGAMHVLAVSGLHVGLVYIFLNHLLFFFKKGRRQQVIKAFIIVLVILIYAGITGFSPSVTRAAIMFSLVALGKIIRKGSSIYNIIFVSAFGMLFFDPTLLFNVSFQLSYVAVIGIIYLFPRLFELWVPGNAVVQYLWGLVCLSLSAQLVTFPIALYYFGLFPSWFLLTNLIVVPAAVVELGGGLLLLAVDQVPVISSWYALAYTYFIQIVNALLAYINQIPPGALRLKIDGVSLALVYLIIGLILLLFDVVHKRVVELLAISSIVLVGYSSFRFFQNENNSGLLVYSHKAAMVEQFAGDSAIVWLDTTKVDLVKAEQFVLQPSWNLRGIKHVEYRFFNASVVQSFTIEQDLAYRVHTQYPKVLQPNFKHILARRFTCKDLDKSVYSTSNRAFYAEYK
jgi:competence protein ComEC